MTTRYLNIIAIAIAIAIVIIITITISIVSIDVYVAVHGWNLCIITIIDDPAVYA